jgi:hypothetical protein
LTSVSSGCHFAGILAAHAKVTLYSVSSFAKSDLPTIDGFIESSATDRKTFFVLFPHVRSAPGILKILDVLDGGERWSVERLAWRKHARSNAVPIGVYWSNSAGNRMSVMGFAPLLAMPTTRRAPYVGIAIWGGGHENKQRNKEHPTNSKNVGIVDVPTLIPDATHTRLWNKSTEHVASLLRDPSEDVEHLRKVAFCLPRSALPKGWKR